MKRGTAYRIRYALKTSSALVALFRSDVEEAFTAIAEVKRLRKALRDIESLHEAGSLTCEIVADTLKPRAR